MVGLKGLNQKLTDMKSYLDKVNTGELPMNHEITYQLQDIFNLLPDVTNPCFVRSLQVNCQALVPNPVPLDPIPNPKK